MLLLPSGAISASLEKVLTVAELIADIYQESERGCVFLMNSYAQQQGKIEFNIFCDIFDNNCPKHVQNFVVVVVGWGGLDSLNLPLRT
jgi:hypothetical protein